MKIYWADFEQLPVGQTEIENIEIENVI